MEIKKKISDILDMKLSKQKFLIGLGATTASVLLLQNVDANTFFRDDAGNMTPIDGFMKLDQTTPQTFTAGTVTGSGLLNVSSGTLGLDTNTYLQSGGWYDTDQSSVNISGFNNDSGYLTYGSTISYAESSGYANSSDYANSSGYADSAGSASWDGYSFPSYSYGTGGYLYFDGYGSLSWASLDLSGYVPYSGATGDVDLGTYALTTTGYITGELAKVTTDAPTAQQGNLWLDTDEAITYKFGGLNDYTEFDVNTGHQTMVGDAQPWEDLRIEPVVRQTAGTGVPAFEKYFDDSAGTSRGVFLYSFTDENTANQKEIFFTMQMPHAWNGGAIKLHIHWVGNEADTDATPIWGLEYTWKEIGEVFGDTTIVYTTGGNIDGSGTADPDITVGKHYISEFGDLTPGTSADGLSSILIGRLFRFSGDASDTYNVAGNKCGLLYIDAHYQSNSLGSDEEYVK